MKKTRSSLLLVAALAMAAPSIADAQPRPRERDRRTPAKPRPRSVSDATVASVTPQSGPAGTTVTIRGKNLPERAVLLFGGEEVKPNASSARSLTFVVPATRPGARTLKLRSRAGTVDAGRFEVTRAPGDRDRVRDDRDDRGRDRVRDDRDDRGRDRVRDDRDDRGRDRVRDDRGERRADDDRRDPPRGRARHRERDRATVSGMSPIQGKPGSRVTIRGYGFEPGMKVVLGGSELKPARVTDDQIVFVVPRGAEGEADVRLRSDELRRDLVVGNFAVSDARAAAERKRLEAERRRRAEQDWAKRQGELAQSRADRLEALREREEELARTRAERRRQRLAEIQQAWQAAFLADEDTQAELSLHGERTARLQRMKRLAEANGDGKLVVRIDIALDKENTRHERRMSALESAFRAN